MITKYQSDIENNHVRGITPYTPPTYTYIGLYKEIKKSNGLDSDTIYVGQVLKI